MHLLVPFAAPVAEFGDAALTGLRLPALATWLSLAGEPERDEAELTSLNPPHERALARALGLAGADGSLPLAACELRRQGREPGDLAWGRLTPVHWQLGSDQATLADPARLDLDEAQSRALFDAVHDLFEDEGRLLLWCAPQRWYMAHESLQGLRTASPDRAVGRNVDFWQPPDEQGRLWRRLQSEVQMRWHQHPVNEAREARGAQAVNSLWLSGCGVAPPSIPAGPAPTFDERLRAPALDGDAQAWREAWLALDRGPLADLLKAARRGAETRLTLCGERSAVSWRSGPGSGWRRLAWPWRRARPAQLLGGL